MEDLDRMGIDAVGVEGGRLLQEGVDGLRRRDALQGARLARVEVGHLLFQLLRRRLHQLHLGDVAGQVAHRVVVAQLLCAGHHVRFSL